MFKCTLQSSWRKKIPSKVYFCSRINAENLVKAYQALGREAKATCGYKTPTGEAGNPNHLSTDVIKQLVSLQRVLSWNAIPLTRDDATL